MSDEFQSHERLTATKLNRALRAGRCIARGRRITNSSNSTSTTKIPVLRIDDVPIMAGRLYEITTSVLQCDANTNNDTAVAEILYTTDGTTPTVSSTLLPGAAAEEIQPSAASPIFIILNTTYIPAADETLSLLLTIRHGVGTSVLNMLGNGTDKLIEIRLIDLGEDPGDTGVDL